MVGTKIYSVGTRTADGEIAIYRASAEDYEEARLLVLGEMITEGISDPLVLVDVKGKEI